MFVSLHAAHTVWQKTAFPFVGHIHKLNTRDLGYFTSLLLFYPSLSNVSFNRVGYCGSEGGYMPYKLGSLRWKLCSAHKGDCSVDLNAGLLLQQLHQVTELFWSRAAVPGWTDNFWLVGEAKTAADRCRRTGRQKMSCVVQGWLWSWIKGCHVL